MARTAYNDSQAEAIYQHGAGNSKRMPDALQNLPYGPGKMSGMKEPTSGHDQKKYKPKSNKK